MKTKHLFYIYNFCNILEKTGYFNTKFISLQYKNTNQYESKLVEKYTGKSQSLKGCFWIFLINNIILYNVINI